MSISSAPSPRCFAITPSDTVDFTKMVRYIYVGTSTANGGTITIVNNDNTTVTFSNVLQGSTIGPFNARRVNATGTTATNLVGFE